jgi:hypothetical protein
VVSKTIDRTAFSADPALLLLLLLLSCRVSACAPGALRYCRLLSKAPSWFA